jgi:hypothetical protein
MYSSLPNTAYPVCDQQLINVILQPTDLVIGPIYSTYRFNIILSCVSRPALWSNGQSSWLQIQRPWFDSQPYQMFWEIATLERGPLSLASTIEELLERKNSGSGLESREYGRRDPSRWQRGTVYPQNLVLTSSTSGSRSFDILRVRLCILCYSVPLPVSPPPPQCYSPLSPVPVDCTTIASWRSLRYGSPCYATFLNLSFPPY